MDGYMTPREELAVVVAYAEDDYLRLNGTLGGSALFVADRIIAYLEPTYEYACFAHEITGAWDSRPDVHISVCPHVVRRTVAGEWEEVE